VALSASGLEELQRNANNCNSSSASNGTTSRRKRATPEGGFEEHNNRVRVEFRDQSSGLGGQLFLPFFRSLFMRQLDDIAHLNMIRFFYSSPVFGHPDFHGDHADSSDSSPAPGPPIVIDLTGDDSLVGNTPADLVMNQSTLQAAPAASLDSMVIEISDSDL
jgi:hypothetical protein